MTVVGSFPDHYPQYLIKILVNIWKIAKLVFMKQLILTLCAATFLTAFQQPLRSSLKSANGQYDWQMVADGMSSALIDRFWGANFDGYPQRYYFNYGSDLSDMTTIHYWPQAHAMDVLVDAYTRTGNSKYADLFPFWWLGAPTFNTGDKDEDPWWNVYVDDMEWIALTLIRMFESTGNDIYYKKARQLFDNWIWPTWGPEDEAPWYGGITWKTDVGKSKNACSNGPAAIIAARLYRFYDSANLHEGKSKVEYLAEAIKIFNWERTTLFDSESGAVYDNINRQGRISRAVYSYNPGTFIGAAHELFTLTGDQSYLVDAVKAADYVLDNMTGNNGMLKDDPKGDGGLFHGIFFRYFAKLINEPALDSAHRAKYIEFITRSAETLVEHGLNHNTMLYGGKWWEAPADDESVCLTAHLTGCMLIEAMCTLE